MDNKITIENIFVFVFLENKVIEIKIKSFDIQFIHNLSAFRSWYHTPHRVFLQHLKGFMYMSYSSILHILRGLNYNVCNNENTHSN